MRINPKNLEVQMVKTPARSIRILSSLLFGGFFLPALNAVDTQPALNSVPDAEWIIENWYLSPTFSYFWHDNSDWIYSFGFREWLYPVPFGGGYWIWWEKIGWIWTNNEILPWCYRESESEFQNMLRHAEYHQISVQDIQISCSEADFVSSIGQPVNFSIALETDRKAYPDEPIDYQLSWDGFEPIESGKVSSANSTTQLAITPTKAGFIRLRASLQGSDESVVRSLAISPELITSGQSTPRNFSRYWTDRVAKQKSVPMYPAIFPTNNTGTPAGTTVSEVRINALGGQNCVGYFGKPSTAAAQSLPAILNLQMEPAYDKNSSVALKAKRWGCLVYDVQLHGWLLGAPSNYYIEQSEQQLQGYILQNADSLEDSYYAGMILRVARALEFLKLQPEWDGETIIVMGEGEGGGLACAAAGFDSKVKMVILIAPALCDQVGFLAGHSSGYPWAAFNGTPPQFPVSSYDTEIAEVWQYFDPANFAPNSNAGVRLVLPLSEEKYSLSGMYATFNRFLGQDKIAYAYPEYTAEDLFGSIEIMTFAESLITEFIQTKTFEPINSPF